MTGRGGGQVVAGRLERLDLGPGAWVLVGDDGRRWALAGDLSRARDGARAQVVGEPVDAVGFGMTGEPTLAVRSLEVAAG